MKVKFEYAIYRNEENEYCTYKYRDIENDKTVTCIGYNLPTAKILYDFDVEEVFHNKYGLQYRVKGYKEIIGNSKANIIEYLSSGLIKGIGRKIAEKIYDRYGEDSIDIVANHSERLLDIKGISQKKLEEINKSYSENHISNEITTFFINNGFSIENIHQFYKKYGEELLKVVEKNPYKLCEFKGMSFGHIDRLGKKFNISPDSQDRLYAAAIQAIKNEMMLGSVGIKKEDLLDGIVKLTFFYDKKIIWTKIISLIKSSKIAYRKVLVDSNIIQYIYLPEIKKMEEELAEYIVRLLKIENDESEKAISYLKECEDGALLDQSQYEAAVNAFTYSLSIMSGGPGTGKTTTINKIAEVQQMLHPDEEMYFMAPTGLASRKIAESTEKDATTIHSGFHLGIHYDDQIKYFQDNILEIEEGMLVIDEFSMIDMMLAHKIFKNTKKARFIIVGDINQLPSVGPGAVLRDLIESEIIPVSYLKYVHRQEEGSTICDNAHAMLNGTVELKEAEDFECCYIDETLNESRSYSITHKMKIIEDYMVAEYVKAYHDPFVENIMCLSPYKEFDAGVYALNSKIQNQINPLEGRKEFQGSNGMVFRVGDKVMHIRKNTEDIVNGDLGKVVDIQNSNDGSLILIAEFEMGKKVIRNTYTKKNINELTLAYAITYHKSQGSESEVVILCITEFHKRMLKRNILYTGITRAKRHVKLFSTNRDLIRRVIENTDEERRNTLLAYLIREKYGNIYEQKKLDL